MTLSIFGVEKTQSKRLQNQEGSAQWDSLRGAFLILQSFWF
jgi:hypothetical protein